MNRLEEIAAKLAALRAAQGAAQGAALDASADAGAPGCPRALRLRGVDWFAWATAGGSNAVLLAAETGVAEVLVTADDAWVLTDAIEARRLLEEELPDGIEAAGLGLQVFPWAAPREREDWVRKAVGAAVVGSDRPAPGSPECPLPEAVLACKRRLLDTEIVRYREVGARAARAMTEALAAARPDWSERRLAGAGAQALLARGLEPALILAAGAGEFAAGGALSTSGRLARYRHPLPTDAPLGSVAKLVFCARGHGLYANLTRFVRFGPLPAAWEEAHAAVREIEAVALAHSRPGVALGEVYAALAEAYRRLGRAGAIAEHHQGGTTGYLAREVIARPDSTETLTPATAVAWNPSLPGAKIEDTFVLRAAGDPGATGDPGTDALENLTLDPAWPTSPTGGRARPDVWAR